MEATLRRLLTFPCEGETLAATLDGDPSTAGVLIVTGGSQTRIGSHRLFERLSKQLSNNGFSCFRFDRRGVGDSSGKDPDFRGSGPDLKAAVAAFGAAMPQVERVYGFGLCDGATALALHGHEAGMDGIILVNPWLVEAESGEPPPAAIRSHYRRRLTSAAGWKKLLGGGVNFRKLISGLRKASRPADTSLAGDAALGLAKGALPAALILANADNTAVAAAAEVKRKAFEGLITWSREIDTDSHTFARPGDQERLLAATLDALALFEAEA